MDISFVQKLLELNAVKWQSLSVEAYNSLLRDLTEVLNSDYFAGDLSSKSRDNITVSSIDSLDLSPTSKCWFVYCLTFAIASSDFVSVSGLEELCLLSVRRLHKIYLYTEWAFSPFHNPSFRQLLQSQFYVQIAKTVLEKIEADLLKSPQLYSRLDWRNSAIEIFKSFGRLMNLQHPTRKNDIPDECRDIARMMTSDYPALSLLVIPAFCRTLYSMSQAASFSEVVMEKYLAFRSDGHFESKADESWDDVAVCLEIPRLFEIEFLELCLERGFVLTLSAAMLQKLKAVTTLSEGQGIVLKALQWIENGTVNVKPVEEHKLVALLLVILRWIMETTVKSLQIQISSELSKRADGLLVAFQKALRSCYEDQNLAGFLLSKVGMAKRQFSPNFRISCRVLDIILTMYSNGRNGWFWTEAFPDYMTPPMPEQAKKLIKDLQALERPDNKEFSILQREIHYSCSALEDLKPMHPLRYLDLQPTLRAYVVNQVFPAQLWIVP
jgi:hypothetical protein